MRWQFWIDTGGTFTDVLAQSPQGDLQRLKVLSSSAVRGHVLGKSGRRRYQLRLPYAAVDGFYVGYRLGILGGVAGQELEVIDWRSASGIVELDQEIADWTAGGLCELRSPEEPPILAARLATGRRLREALPQMEMRLATTRGTNALLERRGAAVAFFVTRGFGDLLRIGNQQRPDLFEIGIQKPAPLHAAVFEIGERLDRDGGVVSPLDEAEALAAIDQALSGGAEAFAVAFAHSYRNPQHEQRVAALLEKRGARFVSISSDISPFIKLLPRAETAVVDAYLAPVMDHYLDAVQSALGEGAVMRVMSSAGGLTSRASFRPKDSLLSGPAGGVVGASLAAEAAGYARSIAFDMGGTSTDVSRYDGAYDYRFEQRIGDARVFAPTLRIETIAAGGGSICWFDGSALRVGPRSAGAYPGPACYGAGGPLALTDINLLLGRVSAAKFGIPIDESAARAKLGELQEAIAQATGERIPEDSMLRGLLSIADERMAEAIARISVGEGFDVREYALVAFGGAGGLHACAIANILGMDTILFPGDAGLLSASGLRSARMEQFAGMQVLQPWDRCRGELGRWLTQLQAQAREALLAEGIEAGEIEFECPRYELRFFGQESVVPVDAVEPGVAPDVFFQAYQEQFGFLPEDAALELVSLRVMVRSRVTLPTPERFAAGSKRVVDPASSTPGPVFVDRAELSVGDSISGPLSVQDHYSTVFVDRGWRATVGTSGSLLLEREKISATPEIDEDGQLREASSSRDDDSSEVVELELFTNRFRSLVDGMGALLERTAFSTNVRDRKDFSCALLDREGFLVANAPHIPVHLGALGVCLRSVLETMSLDAGDVIITNHPGYGGSHLPDVTLLAPVHAKTGELLGYVANRAHHAEMGGIVPGSMPPDARCLAEEGVVIAPLKLVQGGTVSWDGVMRLLRSGPHPSRSPRENKADLAAQLASIRRGAAGLISLAEREGTDRVARFATLLKHRSAEALRRALDGVDLADAEATLSLDNGAALKLVLRAQREGKWMVDFTGSAAIQANSYNATPAIVTSACMYALRLLAAEDLPLNEGFLDVIELRIPSGFLNPKFVADPALCPAVVAGNVELSQLIVSALLKALGLAAASQTTMNNLIFGNELFGYYETIGGGEGGSPRAAGASGVHTHMTNTAITEPEILELRYPVRLERFSLRPDSGGDGLHAGGDGLVRRLRFLDAVTVSLLTQSRVRAPFGLAGGRPGACGAQFRVGIDGVKQPLPGNGSFHFQAGEALEIHTPGGGGWGSVESSSPSK